MILHRYFATKFLLIYMSILAVFFVLLTMVDLIEQVQRYSTRDLAFFDLFKLTLLNVPEGLYNIMPLVMILSTVTLFLGLARSSELVVTRAAGRSALSSLMAPLVVACAIGVLAVAMLNPIVAATTKRYHTLSTTYRTGSTDVLSISAEGLWLRQGGPEGQTVIRATRANPNGTVLFDVTFISYAADDGPNRRIHAKSAQLRDGEWQLQGARVWPLGSGVNPQEGVLDRQNMVLPSTLTQERIQDSFGNPNSVHFWDLPTYIQQLRAAGFSARRHAVWYHMEMARPLFLMAMVLISAAFTMRHVRFARSSISVLAAILLGFGLYYIRNFAQALGENGQIPVVLAAWAPPVASIFLATGLVLHMEDG
ncbi:MAG: LPS export ABC transporter permease LptG [Sediminimonas qiaohouensis]|uniref:LPS export ABC transporter permease LptG n=1 Tax=Sediminimonas qiaohouensis TaxID=552061 RepID=A0A7C9HAH0_9RHOB|nr:LPS export ABC transporter permease LptG [Sediminimonas qiaohouensis]MTJ04289.1 LPS export ABC transporter permease LptG [Sediminimonas qiaohouensis]